MMDVFWNELPQEWIDAAPDFTLQRVRTMLDRWKADPEGFWTHA
jgi:hypothetical protein